MNKYKNKGFTLIELLIVIGIIAILASAVIVAINPGQQFAAARDTTRERYINSLYNSLISYQVSNNGNLSGLPITTETTEICNTNLESPTCTDLVDLSALVDEGHLNQIPVDPQATGNGTGYEVAEGSIILVAPLAETRFIGMGIVESEYDEGGEETFTCGDTFDYEEQTYATVEIGTQCWMAENLNVGDMLSDIETIPTDDGNIEKHCYNDDSANCDNYGGLYTWNEMMEYSTNEGIQGICPEGWHIPSHDEFTDLERYVCNEAENSDCTTNFPYDLTTTGGRGIDEGDRLKDESAGEQILVGFL